MKTINQLRKMRKEISSQIELNEKHQSAIKNNKEIKNSMLLRALESLGHELDFVLGKIEAEILFKGGE